MQREILFRGKRVDNDEWIEGDLIHLVENFEDVVYILNWRSEPNKHKVKPESVGQYIDIEDKSGDRIFKGDIVRYRIPYRTTQTHTGDNIPNGSYTEPMEPGIKDIEGEVKFENGMFFIDSESNHHCNDAPIGYFGQDWDLESIKDAISWSKHDADIFDDPEEGDLQYLIKEVANVNDEKELIDYLSGFEIIGNVHDNPELL